MYLKLEVIMNIKECFKIKIQTKKIKIFINFNVHSYYLEHK